MFWRVVNTFILARGRETMRVYRVTFRDAKRPLSLREGKNKEDAELTSYTIRSSAPVDTSPFLEDDLRVYV